jgi:glucokinase
MGKEIVLAADLGSTNLRAAAVDCEGTILYRAKRVTPRGESGDDIVRAIVECAGECRKNCADSDQFKVICVGIPGSVNAREGIIITAPNLPSLNNYKMAAALENELGIKAVLENDVNASAIGENWRGASRGFADSVLVMLGTGVGAGIIISGNILRGAGGMTVKIGHICVESFGAVGNCFLLICGKRCVRGLLEMSANE